MTISTLVINNLTDPVEIQEWLDAHPTAVIRFLQVQQNIAYIICE